MYWFLRQTFELMIWLLPCVKNCAEESGVLDVSTTSCESAPLQPMQFLFGRSFVNRIPHFLKGAMFYRFHPTKRATLDHRIKNSKHKYLREHQIASLPWVWVTAACCVVDQSASRQTFQKSTMFSLARIICSIKSQLYWWHHMTILNRSFSKKKLCLLFLFFFLDGSCQLCSILLPLVKFGIATVRHQEGTSQF